MTPELKRNIQEYATQAALAGISTLHACPYAVGTDEWLEFQAAYRCAGMVFEVAE